MSSCCGRNKVKTTEQGSVQKSIAEAQRRQYKRECDPDTPACSIESVYGNHGVPLQSAGDFVAFIKASAEQTSYNASLYKGGKIRTPQPCINLCNAINPQ